jgi:hypothetical protein
MVSISPLSSSYSLVFRAMTSFWISSCSMSSLFSVFVMVRSLSIYAYSVHYESILVCCFLNISNTWRISPSSVPVRSAT